PASDFSAASASAFFSVACVDSPLVLAQPAASRMAVNKPAIGPSRALIGVAPRLRLPPLRCPVRGRNERLGTAQRRSYLRPSATLGHGPVAIKPEEQRQQGAARQDQFHREIGPQIAQLTDDPHDP